MYACVYLLLFFVFVCICLFVCVCVFYVCVDVCEHEANQ
jgi:hypothetical protein